MNTTYKVLESLIPQAGRDYCWQDWCEAVPGLRLLETCPQDPFFHAEGSVAIHTRMCLDALLQDPYFAAAERDRQVVLFLATMLHDLAKPATTVVDEVTGAIRQPGHSTRGAVDARILLWSAGMPFELREAVCRIISFHQVPFFAFNSRRGESPEFIARTLSWQLRLPELVAVARADMQGRTYRDKADSMSDIQLFEELAREDGCWDGPRATVNDHTRLAYARFGKGHPDFAFFQEPGSDVVVMSGLPASGKDTWVAKNCPHGPVISFDDARKELGLSYGENDGKAAHLAVDKAKALLRDRRPFVWNATNLSRLMRNKALDLLYAYNAQVRIVYLESPRATVMKRNQQRDSTLSNARIEEMLFKWEVPTLLEAHQVSYLT